MIVFEDVRYAYEEEAVLRRVRFRLRAGEAALLAGPNGAGKSTLLKLMNGLLFPARGRYLFDGTEITAARMKDVRFAKSFHQRVALLWQNPDVQLFCGSVEEELAFAPRQMGFSEEETARRVEDALRLLDIVRLRRRAPYFLSGGEKKKVAIASLLTMNPEVWTMDEPLVALDEASRGWLVEFLRALKAAGKTLVLATHEEAPLRALADRRLVLPEGVFVPAAMPDRDNGAG